MEKVGRNVGRAFSKERLRNKLRFAALGLQPYPPAAAPHGVAANLSFAPGPLAPPCTYCFRFGPAHPISKLLKLFKLLSQHLNTMTEGKRTIGSLSGVTQYALPKHENQWPKKPRSCPTP
jgi:hypothetical protein